MRRSPWFVSGFAVFFLALTAAFPANVAALSEVLPDQNPEIVDHALFLELPESLEGGAHTVETVVLVNGLEVRREGLEVPAVVAGTAPAVELFAFQPGTVSELLTAVQVAKEEVILQVSIDGAVLLTQPLEEMIRRSLDLRRWGFTPVDVLPRSAADPGSLQRLVAPAGASCEADCWDALPLCEERCCCPTDPECEARCAEDLDRCLDHCAQCPSTREYLESVTVSQVYVGPSRCLEDHLVFFTGKVYNRMYRTVKVTRYRETTQCDGSSTTVVVSVTYTNYYCWARSLSSCSPYSSNFGYFLCL